MWPFWGMEQQFKAHGDTKRVPSWDRYPSGRVCDAGTGAIPDLLGSAGMGLFASIRPVLLWANYLQNAFLILREIT